MILRWCSRTYRHHHFAIAAYSLRTSRLPASETPCHSSVDIYDLNDVRIMWPPDDIKLLEARQAVMRFLVSCGHAFLEVFL